MVEVVAVVVVSRWNVPSVAEEEVGVRMVNGNGSSERVKGLATTASTVFSEFCVV